MICELCKKQAAHAGMSAVLKDVNGTTTVQLCQPCLKKLKQAYKSTKPMNIDIYPDNQKK